VEAHLRMFGGRILQTVGVSAAKMKSEACECAVCVTDV